MCETDWEPLSAQQKLLINLEVGLYLGLVKTMGQDIRLMYCTNGSSWLSNSTPRDHMRSVYPWDPCEANWGGNWWWLAGKTYLGAHPTSKIDGNAGVTGLQGNFLGSYGARRLPRFLKKASKPSNTYTYKDISDSPAGQEDLYGLKFAQHIGFLYW